MKKVYCPSKRILENYANVLVNFALGSGNGIKKGDVVQLIVQEVAKPLYIEIRRAIWKVGGHVISDYRPSNDKDYNVDQDFYLYSEDHQIEFFPASYMKGLLNQVDHSIFIDSETNLRALGKIDSKKILSRSNIFKPWKEWRDKKENAGKFTWTLATYATEEIAKESRMILRGYWNQIIKSCFLNEKDPVAKWKSVYFEMEEYKQKLNDMNIDKVHVESEGTDLWIKIGDKRKWVGGSGRNVPSFEIFTSPDWRGTNGHIKFDQPLYAFGNFIEGIELEFKDGIIVKSKAKRNEKLLKEIISTDGANKIGEFSMTDKRFSRITKFMANTLYDENFGGKYGNTHIAIGNSYHDCYMGNPDKVSKSSWNKLGYNNSSVHNDIISTTDRKITAFLKNGKEKIIFENGKYTF